MLPSDGVTSLKIVNHDKTHNPKQSAITLPTDVGFNFFVEGEPLCYCRVPVREEVCAILNNCRLIIHLIRDWAKH